MCFSLAYLEDWKFTFACKGETPLSFFQLLTGALSKKPAGFFSPSTIFAIIRIFFFLLDCQKECVTVSVPRPAGIYSTSSNAPFFIVQVLCCPEFTVLTPGNGIICSIRMCRDSGVSRELRLYNVFQKDAVVTFVPWLTALATFLWGYLKGAKLRVGKPLDPVACPALDRE